MDIAVLNNILHSDAKALGACDKVMGQWQGLYDIPTLIALFVHNQEFCIAHDFPSIDFIKSNFNVEERTENGVYLNDKVAVHGYSGTLITMGNSKGFVLADGYDAITIYARHNSDLHISCKGFSKVFIRAYDNCKLNIEQGEMSKVYVYRYGEKSIIKTDGDIIFHQK